MSGYFGAGKEGEPALNYDEYLKVPQLLKLQQCRSNPAHHDEMLFIIIHQTYELWFRLILHECDGAIAALDADNCFTSERNLQRVCEIWRILVPQIHVLETMLPSDFLAFRDHLKPASGFQSAQFREVEIVTGLKDTRILSFFQDEPEVLARLEQRLKAPTISDAFYAMLNRRGFSVEPQPRRDQKEEWERWCEETVKQLMKIYSAPRQHYDLYQNAERMIEFDEYIQLWRFHHVRMVERMIGLKYGTGGSDGVGYLQRTLSHKSFPELWQVRTHLEL